MSETVIVALITFSAGVVGACIGAVATYQVSKLSISNERLKMLREEKKSCYSAFLTEYISFTSKAVSSDLGIMTISDQEEQLAFAKFLAAYNQAILLSPDEVTVAITILFTCVSSNAEKKTIANSDFHSEYNAAVSAMRRDLSTSTKKRRKYFR